MAVLVRRASPFGAISHMLCSSPKGILYPRLSISNPYMYSLRRVVSRNEKKDRQKYEMTGTGNLISGSLSAFKTTTLHHNKTVNRITVRESLFLATAIVGVTVADKQQLWANVS